MKLLFLLSFFSLSALANVRHFVAFRYKASVTMAERKLIRKKFLDLQKLSLGKDGRKLVLAMESGLANSPEMADLGMHEAFLVTFNSTEDRNYYVGKPFFNEFEYHHDQFKSFVGPFLDLDNPKKPGVFVFDYAVK